MAKKEKKPSYKAHLFSFKYFLYDFVKWFAWWQCLLWYRIKKKYDDFVIVLAFGAGYASLIEKIENMALANTLYAPDVPIEGGGLFTARALGSPKKPSIHCPPIITKISIASETSYTLRVLCLFCTNQRRINFRSKHE